VGDGESRVFVHLFLSRKYVGEISMRLRWWHVRPQVIRYDAHVTLLDGETAGGGMVFRKALRNLVRPEEGLLTVTRKAGLCVY